MRTKGDCMSLFLRYLDEATKKGVDLPTTKNADYRDKFNFFLNEAQIYISTLVKIPEVMNITQNPIPNQLGLLQGFEIRQYLPGSPIEFTQIGTKSYYFEMDNVGTVTISINGVTAQTINNTGKRKFTVYKANTGAQDADTVTITFSGLYPYNIRNVGLYAYAFPTDEDVPDYTPYVSYPMPEDFMSFDTIINRADPRVYQAYMAYKWENNRRVILNYYDAGSFDIHYFRYPAQILPTDLDSTPMDVEDKAIDLVVLQAGIKATAADNPSLSSWLRSLYMEQVQNIVGAEMIGETTVQTIYSMM